MSNPRFYIGQLDQATFTMTEAENDAYPLSNLKSHFPAYLWRSSTMAANQSLVIDFGSAKACDFVIVEGHNFADLGADAVKLQAADDDGFSVNLVTISDALAGLSSPGKIEFTEQSKRYWRILFEKAAGDLSTFPELGQAFINKKFEVTQGYNWGYRGGNTEYQTAIKPSLSGIELTYQAHDGHILFEFRFSLQDDDFKTKWVALHNAARGRLYPFYFYDIDDQDWYVCLTEDYNPVRTVKKSNHETDTIRLRAKTAASRPRGFGTDFGEDFGGGF